MEAAPNRTHRWQARECPEISLALMVGWRSNNGSERRRWRVGSASRHRCCWREIPPEESYSKLLFGVLRLHPDKSLKDLPIMGAGPPCTSYNSRYFWSLRWNGSRGQSGWTYAGRKLSHTSLFRKREERLASESAHQQNSLREPNRRWQHVEQPKHPNS